MISMQYEFILPTDYDMAIIRNRVRDKGHFLDQHQPLLFKAYLMAERGDPVTRSGCNLYAPFYLWQYPKGLGDFLLGPGFRGVAEAFGCPAVMVWPAILAVAHGSLETAVYARREIRTIPLDVELTRLQEEEQLWAEARLRDFGDLLALSALEPTGWCLVRFSLLTNPPVEKGWEGAGEVQTYNLLHLSNPGGVGFHFPERPLARE